MFRPGITVRWRQESAPPEAVASIKLGEAGEVLAHASDGSIYEFGYDTPSSWEEVAQPSGSPAIGMSCVPAETSNRLVFPPPEKVVSHVRVNCVMFETAYHLEVVLLENGEVWSWEHDTYAYSELLMFFVVTACFGIGALIFMIGAGMKFYQKVKAGQPRFYHHPPQGAAKNHVRNFRLRYR